MHSTQMEILLKQLLDCSLAIYQAIQNDDNQELDNLIDIKSEKLKLIEETKKSVKSLETYDNIIQKIKEQEQINIKLLNEKKDLIFDEYKSTKANTKVLKKYEQLDNLNGSIVDIRE